MRRYLGIEVLPAVDRVAQPEPLEAHYLVLRVAVGQDRVEQLDVLYRSRHEACTEHVHHALHLRVELPVCEGLRKPFRVPPAVSLLVVMGTMPSAAL